MKIINRIAFTLLVLCFSITACDDLVELDYLDSPNEVTPELASPDDLYNNIQLEFRNVYSNLHFIADELVRMVAMLSDTYVSELPSTTGNGVWNNTYADLFPDIDALLLLAEDRGLDVHAGTAKIMKAYAMTGLVDFFGDVPYSEALQGTDVISPSSDPGASVYAAAEALLDDAISQLSGTAAASPAVDNFYGGDVDNWVTLAKTLKLRMALNSGDAGTINSVVSGGDFIDSESEDFQFNYGNQRTNPNSRHPFYTDSYETSDGQYQSTYYMWLLHSEKGITDPRIRFYFYRQAPDAFAFDENEYSCVYSRLPDPGSRPDHFASIDPNMPYCVLADGYFGRDHGNGQGIPPDGPLRTMYGVYPGGGQWDNNSYDFTQEAGTTGGLGEGIWPILLSSFVDFMRAEAALTLSTGEDARALLESAVRSHIDKVLDFESIIPAADLNRVIASDPVTGEEVTADVLIPDQAAIDAYVAVVLENYDNATDKLDVVGKEYLIALFGNGVDAYNLYRRTGKPNNMMPGLQTGIGSFPRSILYPLDHVTLNSKVSQKTIGDLVFWDNGTSTVR